MAGAAAISPGHRVVVVAEAVDVEVAVDAEEGVATVEATAPADAAPTRNQPGHIVLTSSTAIASLAMIVISRTCPQMPSRNMSALLMPGSAQKAKREIEKQASSVHPPRGWNLTALLTRTKIYPPRGSVAQPAV